jgi:hypothetical protein
MKRARSTPPASQSVARGQRPPEPRRFRDYHPDASNWITLASGEYYPDILPHACNLYEPVLRAFGDLLKTSASSTILFQAICDARANRIQLARVFRKYVCPSLSVEMLKKKSKADAIVARFGADFRPIAEVQRGFDSRPMPDEALCALLWEYKDRGKKGYDLTAQFFELVRQQLPDHKIEGPERAGKDVPMGSVWPDYPKPTHPADFILRKDGVVSAVGFARYDGDRGGSQEDDRPGGYRDFLTEFLTFAATKGLDRVKLVFLNDGPGLLLGITPPSRSREKAG